MGDSDKTMKRAGGTRKMGMWEGVSWQGSFPMFGVCSPGSCGGSCLIILRTPLLFSLSHPKYAPPHLHPKSSHIGTLGPSHSLCPSLLAQFITPVPSCSLSLSWKCQLHAVAKLFFLTPHIPPQSTSPKIQCNMGLACLNLRAFRM